MGQLSDDTLSLKIDINGNKARSELNKLQQTTKGLKDANKDLRVELQKMEAAGKKNTAEYKQLQAQIKSNNATIKDNESAMSKARKQLGLNAMTSKELRKEYSRLKQAMDSTVPHTAEWKKYQNELGQVSRRMNQVRGAAKRTGQAMGALRSLLPVAGIAGLLMGAKNLVGELFNLTKVMEADSIRSSQVFGDSLDYVSQRAGELAGKMGATRREFIAAATATGDLLIPLNFTRQEAAEMSTELQGLSGALDEWTGGQHGAAQVSEILTKAMLGENEQLKQLGIAIRKDSEEFRDLVKEKEKTTNATKAQVEAMVTLELIQRKSADAQAAYNSEGNKLLRLQKDIAAGWRQMKENVVAYFQVSQIEQLENQQSRVNSLTTALYEHNLESEQRKKIINELQAIAPNVVASLDDEGRATDRTREALEKYNNTIIQRIFLAAREEEMTKALTKQAGDYEKFYAAQMRLRDRISELINENANGMGEEIRLIQESGMGILEQASAVRELGVQLNNLTTQGGGQYGYATTSGEDYTQTIALIRGYLGESESTVKRIRQEMQEAQDWLNLEIGESGTNPPPPDGGGGANGEKPKELKPLNTDKFEKEYERSLEAMDKSLDKMLNDFTQKWGNYRDIQAKYGMVEEVTTHAKSIELLKQYYDERIISDQQYKEARMAIMQLMEREDRERLLIQREYEEELRQLGIETDALSFEEQLALEDERFQMQMQLQNERYALEQEQFSNNKTELLRIELSNQKEVKKLESENLKNKQDIFKKEQGLRLGQLQVAQDVLGGIASVMNEEGQMTKALLIVKQGAALAEATMALGLGKAKTAAVGFPQNIPLIAGFIAQTGAFINSIKNATKPMEGKKEGGYSGASSSDDTVTGWHHANEFIVNANGVRNPSVKMVTDIIDASQKNGTINTIDLARVIGAGNSAGRKSGGYTSETVPTITPSQPQSSASPDMEVLLRRNTDLMEKLYHDGVKGVWDFDYDRRSRDKMNTILSDVGT